MEFLLWAIIWRGGNEIMPCYFVTKLTILNGTSIANLQEVVIIDKEILPEIVINVPSGLFNS